MSLVGASPLRDRLGLLALCAVALTTLVPLVWALSMSLKPEESVFRPGLVPTAVEERAVVEGKDVRVVKLRDLPDGRLRRKVAEPGARRIVDVPDDGTWRRVASFRDRRLMLPGVSHRVPPTHCSSSRR